MIALIEPERISIFQGKDEYFEKYKNHLDNEKINFEEREISSFTDYTIAGEKIKACVKNSMGVDKARKKLTFDYGTFEGCLKGNSKEKIEE